MRLGWSWVWSRPKCFWICLLCLETTEYVHWSSGYSILLMRQRSQFFNNVTTRAHVHLLYFLMHLRNNPAVEYLYCKFFISSWFVSCFLFKNCYSFFFAYFFCLLEKLLLLEQQLVLWAHLEVVHYACVDSLCTPSQSFTLNRIKWKYWNNYISLSSISAF